MLSEVSNSGQENDIEGEPGHMAKMHDVVPRSTLQYPMLYLTVHAVIKSSPRFACFLIIL